MSLIALPPASLPAGVEPAAAVCKTQPIVQDGMSACIIWDARGGANGASGPATPRDVRFRITVPTRWCPPRHEDGCPCTTINPYDRELLIGGHDRPATASVNLLDLVSGPLPGPGQGAEEGEGAVMARRGDISPAGRDLLMHIGGEILGVASKLIVAANAAGGVFRLDKATAADQARFRRGEACDVHLDFVFGTEGTEGTEP